jgi:hypothetical protein
MTKTNIISHLAACLIVTLLCGLIYTSVQQSHRSAANDPQLQMARDIANSLNNNRSPNRLFADSIPIDISKTLAPFVVLYNKNGEPVQSTGLLDGNFPKLPNGVFDFSRKNQEDVITWQPRRGIRMAMVVEYVQSPNISFVAVGRSLLEVENRVQNLTFMVFIAWIICIGIVVLHWLIARATGAEKSTTVKSVLIQNKEFFLLLKLVALAGNILFILWVTYNGLKEGFHGTVWQKLSYISLMCLLILNSILIFSKSSDK